VGCWVDFDMKKIYQQIIGFLVKNAKLRAEEKEINFNEEKFIKKHEALLPIIFFYVLIWILNLIAPGILVMELYLIILLVLIIRGLNHYFGWIKILKKD
jgi:hypothetical protein